MPSFHIDGGTTSCRPIRPVNSSGDFLVAEWRTFYSGRPFEQGVHVSGTTFLELRFNAKTDDFSLKEKSLPSGSWGDMHALDLGTTPLLPSWNDQMVFTVQAKRGSRSFGEPGWAGQACWNPALVAMPVYPPAITDADARVHSVRPGSSPCLPNALLCAPRFVTVERHMEENKLDLSPPTSQVLITEEDQPYALKAEIHGGDARTHSLKALYAKSNFVLDLTPALNFPTNGGPIEDPHHIFQDDDFIILFHRHGYIAWDFRPEAAST